MALPKELWADDVQEFLTKDNEFIDKGVNVDDYVLEGAVVHKPQSGGPAAVVRNRSSFPATVVTRTDADHTYVIDEYTSDPFRIAHKDTVELSYDKRMSLLRENGANLKEVVADNLAYNWGKNVPSDKKLETTGTANTASLKKLIVDDFTRMTNLFNNDNVPKTDRYALITADQLTDLQNDPDLRNYFQKVMNLETGLVAELFGWKIMTRSSVITTNSSKAIKLPEAAAAGGDLKGGLFWQRDMVERAWGTVKLFEDLGNPVYYGDIWSLLVRFGGRNVRADNKGVAMMLSVPVA